MLIMVSPRAQFYTHFSSQCKHLLGALSLYSSFRIVSQHLYADSTQVYVSITLDTADHVISKLQDCLTAILQQITSNKLKPNSSKTEFILFLVLSCKSRNSSSYSPLKFLVKSSTLVRKSGAVVFYSTSTSNSTSISLDLLCVGLLFAKICDFL